MRTLRSRQDSGAAAVEFALVLPLLLVLIFGLIDFGRLMNAQLEISSAAREGVRMAALGDPGGITDRVDAAVPSGMAADLTITPGTACPTDTSSDPTTGTTVEVQYPFTFSPAFGGIVKFFNSSSTLGGDITLSSTASMRCGG